jgi:hypothetical protein
MILSRCHKAIAVIDMAVGGFDVLGGAPTPRYLFRPNSRAAIGSGVTYDAGVSEVPDVSK